MIHPTAIIDPGAVLGEDVSVGPYSVIGPDVKIGKGTRVGSHVVICGPTTIGDDNRIFQFSSIGEEPQHAHYGGQVTYLEVGDRNTIREFCTFNRGTEEGGGVTRIGSDNLFMAYVHIAHDCIVGNKTIFANNASLAGHVEVGDHAIFGGFSGMHQFCKVGAHAMTGIATISFKDIPPFVMASGNTAKPYGLNLRGLKRRGFTDDAIKALKSAYKTIYRSGLGVKEAIEQLEELSAQYEEVRVLVDFVASSERGIIR